MEKKTQSLTSGQGGGPRGKTSETESRKGVWNEENQSSSRQDLKKAISPMSHLALKKREKR